MSISLKRTGVISAGLALFSMFFGAGDLIWPLILGGQTGDQNLYAMLGLLVTGVSLPLLGLMAMMLFQGDYRAFFNQTGKYSGIVLIFIIQAILGPFGSIPRLITLSYATIKPYMPEFINLPIFSIASIFIVFLFTIKRNRMVDILGLILCPVLLLSLGAIVFLGLKNPHPVEVMGFTSSGAFFQGLNVGYNTLDLIASFIFAPLVLSYFCKDNKEMESPENRRQVFKKMIKACLIAGSLLATMYVCLTYLAAFYTPILPTHAPEARLATISLYLLGSKGAFISCVAVALVCLTTAIPIAAISADYVHKDFMRGRGSVNVAVFISLGLSAAVANLGFMGIASMLSPILQILCPGLIILSVLNILHKLYEMRMRRVPVFVAFALSLIGYFAAV